MSNANSVSWRIVAQKKGYKVLRPVSGVATMVLCGSDYKPVAAVQVMLKEMPKITDGTGAVALESPITVLSASNHARFAVMFNVSNVPITFALTNFTNKLIRVNLFDTDAKGDTYDKRLNQINVLDPYESVLINGNYSAESKQFVIQKQTLPDGKQFVPAAQDVKAAEHSRCMYFAATVSVAAEHRDWATKCLGGSTWKSDMEYIVFREEPEDEQYCSWLLNQEMVRSPFPPLIASAQAASGPPVPPPKPSFGPPLPPAPLTFGGSAGSAAKMADPKNLTATWIQSHGAKLVHGADVNVESRAVTGAVWCNVAAKPLHVGVSISDEFQCLCLAPVDNVLVDTMIEIAKRDMDAKLAHTPFVTSVCMECKVSKPNVTFYPCNHQCVDKACMAKLEGAPHCPLCRTAVLAVRHNQPAAPVSAAAKQAMVPIEVLQRERMLHDMQISIAKAKMKRDLSRVKALLVSAADSVFAKFEEQEESED